MYILHPLRSLVPALAVVALVGCEGDMIRDAGGGQGDAGSPGVEVDDGGLDGRTPVGDGSTDGGADGGDGSADGGDGGDGATDGGDGSADG